LGSGVQGEQGEVVKQSKISPQKLWTIKKKPVDRPTIVGKQKSGGRKPENRRRGGAGRFTALVSKKGKDRGKRG